MRNIELTDLERKKLTDAGQRSIDCTHGWRPIETAPKDCHILAYGIWRDDLGQEDKEPSINIVEYIGGDWNVTGSSIYAAYVNATHWQPLPKPPNA